MNDALKTARSVGIWAAPRIKAFTVFVGYVYLESAREEKNGGKERK